VSNGFDIAIGMSQAELDAASESIYTQLYPQYFKGSTQVDRLDVGLTVTWDIKAPGSFELSDGAAFSFTFPAAELSFGVDPFPPYQATLSLTANVCIDASSASGQTLDIVSLAAPPLPDPVDNWLLQNVLLRPVLAALQQIFSGATIPALQLPGVALGPPVAFLQSGALIAIAQLGSGTPTVPSAFPWPDDEFFTLLSGDAFQALTSNYIAGSQSGRSDSGSNGDQWAGDDWSYSLGVDDPSTTLQSDGSLTLSASVDGSVSANVYIVYVPIGVGLTAYAEPGLSAGLEVAVDGGELVVSTASVAPFEIAVVPSGSIPDKITGAMLEPIAEAVAASFSPFISAFLGGIRFASCAIPAYSVAADSTTVTVTPTELSVGSVGGMLALTGDVSIST
jgi:hypothetical protein